MMKLNKKLVALILAGALGATLVGCSSKEEPTPETKPEIESPAPEVEEDKAEDKIEEDKTEENKEEVKEEEKEEVKEEAKPEVKPEVKPDPKPEVKPDPKPEVKPDPKPEVKPDPKPEVKPDPKPEEKPSLTAQELYDAMLKGFVQGENMPTLVQVSGDMLQDTYGIDTSLLKSHAVYAPMMMTQSTEIAVFEVNNESDADKIKAGIKKRVEDLTQQWQSYLPEQLELVQNHKIVASGKYIALVISTDADTIVANFNAALK